MPLRGANDTDPASTVLAALASVVTPNTQLAASSGTVAINSWSALYLATYPMIMLEEGRQHVRRVHYRTWQGMFLAQVHYLNRWDLQAATMDAVWATIDLDLRRMKANVEDNPTLTVTSVRHAISVKQMDITPYQGSMRLDIFPFGLPSRTLLVELELPPYKGGA